MCVSCNVVVKTGHKQVVSYYTNVGPLLGVQLREISHCKCCCVFPVQEMEQALLAAAGEGDLPRVKDLIDHGCSVTAQNEVKYTCTEACTLNGCIRTIHH